MNKNYISISTLPRTGERKEFVSSAGWKHHNKRGKYPKILNI